MDFQFWMSFINFLWTLYQAYEHFRKKKRLKPMHGVTPMWTISTVAGLGFIAWQIYDAQ